MHFHYLVELTPASERHISSLTHHIAFPHRRCCYQVYKKYEEALARDAVKAAKLENMISCFACGVQVSKP